MKILLAGPKLCAPWTEGRKHFVRDLAAELAKTHEVRVLTTVEDGASTEFAVPWVAANAGTRAQHVWRLHKGLRELLNHWQPQVVCHLPIGSFHGLYGIGNKASIWLAERQCDRNGVLCLTLMYAIVQEASVAQLGSWAKHLLVNQYAQGANRIRFGIALPTVAGRAGDRGGKSLLFMAGMAERSPERLAHVLHLRGLATLLRAGAALATAGFTLTVAVPLLRDAALRAALIDAPENAWPDNSLRILDTVKVPEIFSGHDYFVFPYARDETQFVPNSVIEAMAVGIPVVLPRLPFLENLIQEGASAFAFRQGNHHDLVDVLLAADADVTRRAAVCRAAAALVRREHAIQGTCEDLLAYVAEHMDRPAAVGARAGSRPGPAR